MYYQVALLVITAALTATSPAHACKCGQGNAPSPEVHFDRSEAVFIGVVRDSLDYGEVVFDVLWSYKGITSKEVRTQGGDDCAFPFQRGRAYVVYASMLPGYPPHAGKCGRTGPLEDRLDDVALLTRRRPLELRR
jgi:hypothetical protein